MPAFNFKARFASAVEAGVKRTTIRARRRDGRDPEVGQIAALYTGMRTNVCRALGSAVILYRHPVRIDAAGIVEVGGVRLEDRGLSILAAVDGFPDVDDFLAFFRDVHGLPFEGFLYQW